VLFPTPEFAFFFFIVFSVSWALRERLQWRKFVLLAASYFFYGYWDWRFMALLAGSTAFNYLAGLAIARSINATVRKRILVGAVTMNLGLLGVFKYYNFFIDSLTDLLVPLGLGRDMPFLEIILPIGISFFTFQGISYVVDVYRKHVAPVRSPLDLFLYISLFPQLVAGPIVRASHFLPQLSRPPELDRTAMLYGFLLILNGMLKKTVIAHYIAVDLVDPVFAAPDAASSFDLAAAAYAYAIQVYCDFSAYSDIAIGVAALLGYRFRKNFDRPFSATSLQQLWQRWHISLSSWLRDYLYRALRGDKRDAGWRMYRNILVTMLLGGLWHGANWTFVCWGAIHGVGLAIERFIKTRWNDSHVIAGRKPGPVLAAASASAGWLITFNLFALAAIFFRCPDIETVGRYYVQMLSFSGRVEFLTPFLLLLTAGAVAVQFLPGDMIERTAQRLRQAPAPAIGLMLGGGLLLIEMASPEGIAPFIYFQF
jgi:D-alanyl-lipoteichoic acid acyltransferase DltB (MBOAT superfamily)